MSHLQPVIQPTYAMLDAELFARLHDWELADAVASIALWKISSDFSKDSELLETLGEGFVIIGSTWLFEAEWMMSAFDCYFGNQEGRMTSQTIASYRRLGYPEAADVIQEALDLWRQEQRGDFPNGCSAAYMALDLKLHETKFNESSKDAMAKYIRAHPEQFYIDIHKQLV